ncbi:MAG TPA: DUF2339 domain-containing protein [Vicinamibacteria bacterium]|nr:DUF2339 domain-containing protein [Vicinamibacteria bacterium]
MEGLIVLFVLGLFGLVLLAPVLAIVAFSRMKRHEARLAALERRLDGLQRVRSAPLAYEAPQPPAPAEPARPAPAVPVTPPATAATPPAPPAAAAPSGPPAGSVSVPRPARPSPPPPPDAPSFDWESLLGLKGAAWLGGITLVIASLFFAKWAIDNDYITPQVRVVVMIAVGVGALLWAEMGRHRGYETAAHAASGAGIAILYVAFYSGHALYGLFPLWLTFAMMALTTGVAGLLAVRYDALFTALLGLLGGFATPVALSTGVDRPVGLFSYLLLLDLGLAVVAIQKRWHALVLLAVAGTFLLEMGWFFRFLSPEKMAIGLGAFALFGLVFLLLPLVAGRDDDGTLQLAAGIGACVPFVFGLLVAPRESFAGQWPLLLGYVALLDAALAAVAVFRGRIALLVGGALATALMLPLWAISGLERGSLWGPSLAAIAVVALLNIPPRVAARLAGDDEGRDKGLAAAGIIGLLGLGLFAAVLVVKGLGDPPGPFLVLLLALVALLIERGRTARWPAVAVLGAAALAVLVQVWFFRHPEREHVLRDLAPGLLLVGLLATAAVLRARREKGDAVEDDAAVLVADGIAVIGLFGCLTMPALGRDPRPLFAALAVALVFVLHAMWRRTWADLALLGLAVAASFTTLWEAAFFGPPDVAFVLPALAAAALGFLAVPFLLEGGRWRDRTVLWATSALALPAFFLAIYRAVVTVWGKGWIGAVPVALAAVSVGALALVASRFPDGPTPVAKALRLRYLALYASVALGFLALAVPLQLDRQWITVGWAVLAAAVCWLFGRLPHPGLKYLATALFAAVGIRLVLNLEVFRYQTRGLPILNWLLYTYGVPALCCFLGAWWLGRNEERRGASPEHDWMPGDRALAPAFSVLGVVLVFWLINVEIVDYFSPGPYWEYAIARPLARDLAMSVAWGLYAIVLLALGIWKRSQGLRFLALGFIYLTFGKVLFYDVGWGRLSDLYRVVSLVSLAASMFVVALLFQRFVAGRERAG